LRSRKLLAQYKEVETNACHLCGWEALHAGERNEDNQERSSGDNRSDYGSISIHVT